MGIENPLSRLQGKQRNVAQFLLEYLPELPVLDQQTTRDVSGVLVALAALKNSQDEQKLLHVLGVAKQVIKTNAWKECPALFAHVLSLNNTFKTEVRTLE